MGSNFFMWLFAALIYLLCGLLYCLCYQMAYKPKEGETALGMMLLGWPLYTALEIVLQIAYGLGAVAKTVNGKLKGLDRAPAESEEA